MPFSTITVYSFWKVDANPAATTLILMCLAASSSALAQTEIRMSVYYVPQLEACRPDGYGPPNTNSTRRCEIVTYDVDVTRWRDDPRVPRQVFVLGADSSDLTLNDELRQMVNSYVQSHGQLGKDDQRAAVFVFDFGSPRSVSVRLTRTRPNKVWTGDLETEQRWIVHLEARWLHPINEIRWTLGVRDESRSFTMK